MKLRIPSLFLRRRSADDTSGECFWGRRTTLGRDERRALRALSKSFTGNSTEAEAYARNRSALAAIEFLDRSRTLSPDIEDIEELVSWKIQILYRSRRWEEIVEELDDFFSVHPELLTGNNVFQCARALWEVGRLKEANDLFDRLDIEPGTHQHRVYTRFQNAWAAVETAIPPNEFKATGKSGFVGTVKTVQEWYARFGLSLEYSELQELLEKSANAAEAGRYFDGTVIGPSDFPRPCDVCAGNLVFVSGFGWSGSGAVTAFLSDHPDVHRVSNKEIVWTQGRTKIGSTSLAEIWPNGSFEAGKFEDFLQTGLLGVLNSEANVGKAERVFPVSFLGEGFERGLPADWLIRQLNNTLRAIACASTVGGIFQALANLAIRSLTYNVPPGQIGLLDNAIMAPKCHVLSLFPNAKMILVKRKLNDQYAARRLESRRRETPEIFEKQLTNTIQRFNARCRQIVNRGRILPISFEEFLQNEGLRENIGGWLGLGEGPASWGGAFDPSQSLKNVGVSRDFQGEEWYDRFLELDQALPYSEVVQFDPESFRGKYPDQEKAFQ